MTRFKVVDALKTTTTLSRSTNILNAYCLSSSNLLVVACFPRKGRWQTKNRPTGSWYSTTSSKDRVKILFLPWYITCICFPANICFFSSTFTPRVRAFFVKIITIIRDKVNSRSFSPRRRMAIFILSSLSFSLFLLSSARSFCVSAQSEFSSYVEQNTRIYNWKSSTKI